MTRHLTDDQLINYAIRTLTDDQRAEMDHHLTACADCRSRLAEHEAVQQRTHSKIIARRNAATPPPRMTYAAIATRVNPPDGGIRLGGKFNRIFSGVLAVAALLALIILLIGVFSGAREATVNSQPAPIDVPVISAAPRMLWKIEGDPDPLISPSRLALDSQGNLYAVDAGNDRILKYDRDGKFLTQWGSHGNGDSQFNFGITILAATGYTETVAGGGVAIDMEGNIYVADTINARIQKFDRSGKFLLKWGSAGDGAGQFGHLVGVAVDGQGNVYTAEDNPHPRVQKFDSNGQFLLQWKTRPSDKGSSVLPNDIAIDHQDLIYLLDLGSGIVQTFDRNGRLISNWTPSCGNRNVITGLTSMAFDSSDNLYAADYMSGRICLFDRNGQFVTQWNDATVGQSFGVVQGIAVDSQGNVYVAEANMNRIQKFQQP